MVIPPAKFISGKLLGTHEMGTLYSPIDSGFLKVKLEITEISEIVNINDIKFHFKYSKEINKKIPYNYTISTRYI